MRFEGPGYLIAREAIRAGEIGSTIEAVEAVCLANERYASNLANRLMNEMVREGVKSARVTFFAPVRATYQSWKV